MSPLSWVEKILVAVVVVGAMAVGFGVWCLLAWVAVLTAGAFGVTLPFWGTVGFLFLASVVLGWFGRGTRL